MYKIAFVVPHYGISGGIHVIFRHAEYLANNGYDIFFISEQIPKSIHWYQNLIGLTKFLTYDTMSEYRFDIVFASSWETVYRLSIIHASHYAYLVQAPEQLFIPPENEFKRILAEQTYICGIKIVTIASWMQKMLLDEYGVDSYLVRNGLLNLKTIISNKSKTCSRVKFLVEGSITDYRKMVPQTVSILKKAGVKDITLLTSSKIRRYPGVTKVYSSIPIDKVGEIYSECDVLVKLSTIEGMFGPPLEMFKCGGTAIVFDVPGHEEYMLHGVNSLVAPMYNFEKVKEYIQLLTNDYVLLEKLKRNAQLTANNWIGWNESSLEFGRVLDKILMTEESNRTLINKRLSLSLSIYRLNSSASFILLRIYLYGGIRKLMNKIKLFIYNL